MGAVHLLAILLVVLNIQQGNPLAVSNTTSNEDDVFTITVRMPNVISQKPDSLICTAMELGPEETYIVKFTPHASKTIAHHMMVFGCLSPANYKHSWICDGGGKDSENEVCRNGEPRILFAWAMDAPEKSLPKGVGMRVSGGSKIKYMVVQMHYALPFPPGVTDDSGISFSLTHTRPPQQVGYIILGNWGRIPPHKPDLQLDSTCKLNMPYKVYPIGFRTHSHNLGFVTSGYRIRNGTWKLIGKMSPRRPQTFYEVNDPHMDIQNGDILASRCSMNSMSRITDTIIGPTNHDEMCNFYILYSTYNQEHLNDMYCFKSANDYSWLDSFEAKDIPKDSGSLDGIPEAEEIKKMFIWE